VVLAGMAEVRFPIEWHEFGLRQGGALVTIRFLQDDMNNMEGLAACIDLMLQAAKSARVPLTRGVSFGFSIARVSSASSMAKDSDPPLRLSMGVDPDTVEDVAHITSFAAKAYQNFFQGYPICY
jgi:threonine dehydratase